MELCKGTASAPTLLATALGSGTGVRAGHNGADRRDNISLALPADGAGRAIEHSGNVAQTVVLL